MERFKVCLLFFPLAWEFDKRMFFTEKKIKTRAALYVLFFKVLLSSKNSS